MKKIRFFIAMLFTVVGLWANAQVTTSEINGKVVDEKGMALPFATVVAIHEPSGTQYVTTTDNAGNYRLTNLRVGGPYKLSISFVGYSTGVYTDINLNLGESYLQNVKLKESTTSLEEVVVSAGMGNPILSSERTGAQTNISRGDINTLPSISRSITDFSKLTPQAQGNSFVGRDGRFNTITVDGAAFNNNFGLSSNPLPGGNAQPISLDAIDQVSVNIAPFDVRVSQFTGASINAVTRSGDNSFKGSAYSYIRPKSFTGDKVDGNDVEGANDRNSQNFGLSFGGPIIKDKLFFFINGEIENEDIPGVTWKPSTDGVANPDQMISRTTEADMIRVRDHLINTYNYDPGKYKNFDPFQNKNTKILARVDWNISKNHKFTIRYNDVVGTSDVETNFNSGPPNNARNSGRISSQSLAFSNSFYGFENTVRSITGELNSTFLTNISNKFLGSYTHIQDSRTSPSKLFPFVDIWEDGDQYMSFGYELFSYNNDVINNTLSLLNNTTINLKKHTLTLGVSFDRLYFKNSYIREGTTYYRYASVDDFINGADPIGFGVTYGYNGEDAPGAELTFGMGAFYAQDEWKVNTNLKVTYGIRLELPFYFDDMKDNPAISALTFANSQKIDVGSWPDPQLLFSPRLGFNWDVKGDRSLQVRGGTGIFTGLLPFVWFTNQPTNSGMIQSPEIGWGPGNANLVDLQFNPNFKEFIASNPPLFPQAPGTLPNNAGLAEVSKDFKMPQVWRSNLAVDVELPYNFVFTGEALFGKDINAVQQININEANPTGNMVGPDNRPFWATANDRKVVSTIANAVVLSNTDKGYQYSFTAQLTKNFSKGFSGMFAYTYTMAKDISSNPGSAAYSAYSSNTAVGSLNNPGLSYSNFATPHQLIGHASYRIEYGGMFATTISLAYRGFQQGRWSYTYSNDLNNDGISSDLIYVPKDKDEALAMFVPYTPTGGVEMTAQQQADAFWAYVNGNDYLKDRKGKYAERFGDVQPWLHRFDVKVLQDIFSNFGTSRRYTLQISLDLLNVGNMLNDKWGAYTYNPLASYDNVRPLTRVALPTATTAPTFRLNANTIEEFETKTTLSKNISTTSTWGALLGIRLIF
ncbi:MAG TPA: carboxypeptidase regulatory-like domain-containing protein [Tenuifilaceae bacterium]|nr:carboxypeptidase regulatory-like domain-containing protein [Tenuifilaceae bacterium]HPM89299.1 carboxypeptidase regulatory-like domain-containing protein [Tenuifilaceae bacterium]